METFLAQRLCAAAGPNAEGWSKLLLVAVARRLGVTGASFGATLAMPMEKIVDQLARCLFLLLPDVDEMRRALDEELEKIGAMCAQMGVDKPPPVDLSEIQVDEDEDLGSPPWVTTAKEAAIGTPCRGVHRL